MAIRTTSYPIVLKVDGILSNGIKALTRCAAKFKLLNEIVFFSKLVWNCPRWMGIYAFIRKASVFVIMLFVICRLLLAPSTIRYLNIFGVFLCILMVFIDVGRIFLHKHWHFFFLVVARNCSHVLLFKEFYNKFVGRNWCVLKLVCAFPTAIRNRLEYISCVFVV